MTSPIQGVDPPLMPSLPKGSSEGKVPKIRAANLLQRMANALKSIGAIGDPASAQCLDPIQHELSCFSHGEPSSSPKLQEGGSVEGLHAPLSCPIEKPNVSNAEVNELVKKLDTRPNIWRSLVNAVQKKFVPAQYRERKLNKLEKLVASIQAEVDADRLTWNEESQRLAKGMVAQKLQQYEGYGSNPEFTAALREKADKLFNDIRMVIVPEEQFERLTPTGYILRSDPTATAPESVKIGDKIYAIGGLISEGSAGAVYRCTDTNTGEKCVVKVIEIDFSVAIMDALREVYTTQQFAGHSHIMSLSSVAITELDKHEMRCLVSVMPEADQGDLENVVKTLAGKSPAKRTSVLIELLIHAADGLAQMHSQGYVHRDIKPGNILVQTGSDGKFIGMLGDLGVARHISQFDSLRMEGTPDYMPTDEKVSLSVDSYAFGMMAFQLLSGGSFPFMDDKKDSADEKAMFVGLQYSSQAMPNTTLLRQRIQDRLPDDVSAAVKLLIERSLSAVPGDRPTMFDWHDALLGTTAKGRKEIADITARIQKENAAEMKKDPSTNVLANDFFRALPQMAFTSPDGFRIAGTDTGGAQAFLTKLFDQDLGIPKVLKATLEKMPLTNTNDMDEIVKLIPKASMTYSIIKMTNQSMIAQFNNHMARGFEADLAAYSFERGPARRINLDISDPTKPKLTVNQIYDYKTDPESEAPDFSVSTGLSVQHDMSGGEVNISVEFKSINRPTGNSLLELVEAHFRSLGAINTGVPLEVP